MNTILVSGHINIETTLKIDNFPINYSPVDYNFYGVNSTIAGVGYNISTAIKILGEEHSLIKQLIGKYNNKIIVIGMGEKGASEGFLTEGELLEIKIEEKVDFA